MRSRVKDRPSVSLLLLLAFLKIRPGDEAGIEEKEGRSEEGVEWKAPINKTPLVAAAALHLLRASTKHHALLVSPRRRQFPSRNLREQLNKSTII